MKSKLGASFRDPSGYLYHDGRGRLLRYVSRRYQPDFELAESSGLFGKLQRDGLLIGHRDFTAKAGRLDTQAYKILEPELVGFISYPYEWSFSQLKDAALATLAIQKQALNHGLSLKDASAYNIQFHGGRPILIDSLSFEAYQDGKPWVAYRQFCQHFLAPLALAAYVDARLLKLLRDNIDGLPLDLAAALLPAKTRFKPQLAMHLHLQAKFQRRYAEAKSAAKAKRARVSRRSLDGIISSLESVVRSLKWQPAGTEWGDYYSSTNYSEKAFEHKRQLVDKLIQAAKPKTVWDLGANTGEFSRLASQRGLPTVAFDIDPVAVEKNYQQVVAAAESNLLPLIIDLTNPSPALGWAHRERQSLAERGPADLILALALIHHLAIGNNVPLTDVAAFLAELGRCLVIEFVPKGDSQVDKLLASREDIFTNYHQAGFEKAFKQYFAISHRQAISGTKRSLYLMKRK